MKLKNTHQEPPAPQTCAKPLPTQSQIKHIRFITHIESLIN